MLYKIIKLFIRIYNDIFAILQRACLKVIDFHLISALRQTLFFRLIFLLIRHQSTGEFGRLRQPLSVYPLLRQEVHRFAGHRFHRLENIRKGMRHKIEYFAFVETHQPHVFLYLHSLRMQRANGRQRDADGNGE